VIVEMATPAPKPQPASLPPAAILNDRGHVPFPC